MDLKSIPFRLRWPKLADRVCRRCGEKYRGRNPYWCYECWLEQKAGDETTEGVPPRQGRFRAHLGED